MPISSTRGVASAKALGLASGLAATYVDDVFSTYLYSGTGQGPLFNLTSKYIANPMLIARGFSNFSKLGDLGRYSPKDFTKSGNNILTIGNSSSDNTPVCYTSTDNGLNWTARDIVTPGSGNVVQGAEIQFGAYFVSSNIGVLKSTNGGSSFSMIVNTPCHGEGLKFVNGLLFTIHTNGSNPAMRYSSDGINFSSAKAYDSLIQILDITYNPSNSTYYMCSYDNDGTTVKIWSSTNFPNWSEPTTFTGQSTDNRIAFGNGTLVMNGSGTNGEDKVYYSTNLGSSWTSVTVSGWQPRSVIFDGTKFIVASNTRTYFSTDGVTWDSVGYGSSKISYADNTLFFLQGETIKSESSTTTVIGSTTDAGMVWIKGRSGATDHAIYDTIRGVKQDLVPNSTGASTNQDAGIINFLPSGINIGATLLKINTSAATYVSWTFREQPKFFDIVTYTGTGANRTIAHSLGSVPGMIMVKRTDVAGSWMVYHNSIANTENLVLNTTTAKVTNATAWNSTTATASVFSLGTHADVNTNTGTYVAYLFAHNAGGFGLTGTDNVISCGSFTGTSKVTLGYEPQFFIMKQTNTAGAWYLYDTMRGIFADTSNNNDPYLLANASNVEGTGQNFIGIDATGFTPSSAAVGPSDTFIYIAIRRGPMRTPTTGTSVFGLSARTGTGANATVTGGQTDDAILVKNRGSAVASLFSSRLTGTGYLVTSDQAAEVAAGTTILQANPWDVMDGVKLGTTSTITNASANTFINYLFRRAPGFFDVVCYTGTGVTGTVAHNLAAVPELMIVRNRNVGNFWYVYSAPTGNTKRLFLDQPNAAAVDNPWNSTSPTASVFTVIGSNDGVNYSGHTYVAYLFATCPGVSKVGSYTGNGTTQTINCGFTGGARFILIKRTDSVGDWYVWDSARGIVAGNDPYVSLNTTVAEVTTDDSVDTDSSGFIVNQLAATNINVSAATYIFLAIS